MHVLIRPGRSASRSTQATFPLPACLPVCPPLDRRHEQKKTPHKNKPRRSRGSSTSVDRYIMPPHLLTKPLKSVRRLDLRQMQLDTRLDIAATKATSLMSRPVPRCRTMCCILLHHLQGTTEGAGMHAGRQGVCVCVCVYVHGRGA